MDGRRRHRGEFYDQHVQGRRSNNKKPPLATWQPKVPTWEKQFCSLVGSVSWKKVLESKRFMHCYDNVVNWNDSAGEEAFHNAKSRYWAEINGLRCDIPLPDPDIYIDQIDWNCEVDPELILDLERDPEPPEEVGVDENGVICNTSFVLNPQSFSCTGWGDEEDFPIPKDFGYVFVPVCGDSTQNADNDTNSWEQNCAPCNDTGKDDGWGSHFNDSGKHNQLGSNYEQWDASYKEVSNGDDRRGGGDWRTWNLDSQKKEGTGQYMSRYKTSRFPGNEYQMDQGWRNRKGGKRSNIACR